MADERLTYSSMAIVWSNSAIQPAEPNGTANAVPISIGLSLVKFAVTITLLSGFVPSKKELQAG